MVLKQTASKAKSSAKRFRKLLGRLGATSKSDQEAERFSPDNPPPGMSAEQWGVFVEEYESNRAEVEQQLQAYLAETAEQLELIAQAKDKGTADQEAESRKEKWDVTLDSAIAAGCVYRLTLGLIQVAVNPAATLGVVTSVLAVGKMCFTAVNRLAGVAWGLKKSRKAWDQEVNKAATDRIIDSAAGKIKKGWEEWRTQKNADKNLADRLAYLEELERERTELREKLERLERRRDELTAVASLAEQLCDEVAQGIEQARGSLDKLRDAIAKHGEPNDEQSDQLRNEVKQLNAYVAMVRKIRDEEVEPIRKDIEERGHEAIRRVEQTLAEINDVYAHFDRETWTAEEFQKRLDGAERDAADGIKQEAVDLAAFGVAIAPKVASVFADCSLFLLNTGLAVVSVDVFRFANIAKGGLHIIEDWFDIKRTIQNRAGQVGAAGITAERDLANFFDHFDRYEATSNALELWNFLGGFEKRFKKANGQASDKDRAKAHEILLAYRIRLIEAADKERAIYERTTANTRQYIVAHNDALAFCERHLREIQAAVADKILELAKVESSPEELTRREQAIETARLHLTQLEQLEGTSNSKSEKELIGQFKKRINQQLEQLEREYQFLRDLPASIQRINELRQSMAADAKFLIGKLNSERVVKKIERMPERLLKVNKHRAESKRWLQHFQVALAPVGGPKLDLPAFDNELAPLSLPELPKLQEPAPVVL